MPKPARAHHKKSKKHDPVSWSAFLSGCLLAILTGALTVTLLVAAKLAFEHSKDGHEAEHWLYGRMHRAWFQEWDPSEALPVTVIDISSLKTQLEAAEAEGGNGKIVRNVTPRAALADLIRAVASHGPYAIGLDLNMAPEDPAQPLWQSDRMLLDLCHSITSTKRSADGSRAVATVLAVGERSQYTDETRWLGSAEYYDLAASASIVTSDPRILPWRLRHQASETELVAFGASLAQSAGASIPSSHGSWLEHMKTAGAPAAFEGWEFDCYWVDYTPLHRLRHEALIGYDPAIAKAASAKIANKVVIIGAMSETADGVPRRGIDDGTAVPGVLVHASGVMSLLRGPVSMPTHGARLALDVLLSGFIILIVQLLKIVCFAWKGEDLVNEHWAHGFFTLVTAALVLLGGYVLARYFRILWNDAFLVALALLLHGAVERWLQSAARGVMATVRQIWKSLTTRPSTSPQH